MSAGADRDAATSADPALGPSARSRRARWVGLAEFGLRRVLGRAAAGGSSRVLLSVAGVAIAVALMTTVTGVSLGLASQSAVQSEGVDYWVVPEQASLDTIAVDVGGPKLGEVHPVAARLTADPRVRSATPVLVQVVPVRNVDAGTREYVVLVGVIPDGGGRGDGDGTAGAGGAAGADGAADATTVAGLPTAALAPGDPYYADGGYDGAWTGEAVVSEATAELLNASEGSTLAIEGTDAGANRNRTRTFSVTSVARGGLETGVGAAPVALVHLAELQAVTGATAGDQADQILVRTNAAGVRSEIEGLYPGTSVVTRTGLATSGRQVSLSSLPFAMAVAAFVVSVVVGALFVATLLGLEVTAERETLAALAAVGYSERSRAALVFLEVVLLSVVGGVVGGVVGFGAIQLVNAAAAQLIGVGDVALFRPVLLAYGLAVALVIGVVASPYPVVLSRRTDVSSVLD